MKYDKLVRDKIPQIIKKSQKNPITYIANDQEYWKRLKDKLCEEVDEFLLEENLEELADILEVIYAICKVKGVDKNDLEKIRIEKKKLRGGLEASGFVEKSGKKVGLPLNLGPEFRPSKKSKGILVEKKSKRLRKGSTGKTIQYFRKSGGKKTPNLFGI